MKRVLLVDDDPVIIVIYRDGLIRHGFEVTTAADGLAALKSLRAEKPDVVVLDLMMPKLSGAEVLEFMHSQKDLERLPVIVLSNAYMDPLAQDAAALGAQRGLLKVNCNPASLAAAILDVLAGRPGEENPDHLLATPQKPPAATPPALEKAPVPAPSPPPAPPTSLPTRQAIEPQTFSNDTRENARRELAANGPAIGRGLGQSFQSFLASRNDMERALRLRDFFRKVHFITAMAGMAEHQALAQMASALEALLYGMMDKPQALEPSLDRTTAMGIEFLQQLLGRPYDTQPVSRQNYWALVVDDDRLANRLFVTALCNAQLQAQGTESPATALELMRKRVYDLVLLDVEMPGMDGFELCKHLRRLPGYEKTPVIYVTMHSDFETRAKTALSGGNDLIAKPVRPAELAVKAVLHLLRRQLGG